MGYVGKWRGGLAMAVYGASVGLEWRALSTPKKKIRPFFDAPGAASSCPARIRSDCFQAKRKTPTGAGAVWVSDFNSRCLVNRADRYSRSGQVQILRCPFRERSTMQ